MNRDNRAKISIITAAYNSERYIEQTIKSVLNQTCYASLEYIIVDGASTDRTMEIVRRYSESIHIVISEKDEGIYDAFNKGIMASSGDLIYFLNSDDYLYDETTLEQVLEAFYRSPQDTTAIYGNILKINESNGYRNRVGQRMTVADLEAGLMPPHPGLFVRREVFEENGLFDLRYSIASDLDFVIKLFKEKGDQCFYLDRVISVFRIGGESSNMSNRINTRRQKIEILNKHFGHSKAKAHETNELNLTYYKKWLEILLYKKQPISSVIWDRGVRDVVIFGSMEMSLYVLKDLQNSGIKVHAFLDNSPMRQGLEMNKVGIYPVEWIRENVHRIDAVIFAFEGNHEEAIKEQVLQTSTRSDLQIVSWKQMVVWNLEQDTDK
ncbi:glycosyltransferase [Cohnella sp.]|uniref:glycosyltransferase n=1 Tax=Cohnella sp. TaxID=1883426 RepID=UPI0035665904